MGKKKTNTDAETEEGSEKDGNRRQERTTCNLEYFHLQDLHEERQQGVHQVLQSPPSTGCASHSPM